MRLPGALTSLSARLLVLTVLFVMLSEVLIFAPSIGRFRLVYLEQRLSDAHLAALALDATPARAVSPELEMRLLRYVQAHAVELRMGAAYTHMLGGARPPAPDARFDLDQGSFLSVIFDAFTTLAQRSNRVLHVIGRSPKDPSVEVKVIIDEAPLRAAMIEYSNRILQLSILISLITAALVYLTLRWLLVRPMMRLTGAMMRFRDNPLDPARQIQPSSRHDEMGVAERELAAMQAEVRAALLQRARLAALGEAVTKINHDLRNILASAELVAERLEESADPEVRRVTPTILGALDRAIALSRNVVEFARAGVIDLKLEPVPLARLLDEIRAEVAPDGPGGPAVAWQSDMPADLTVSGDREQLYRVLVNLARNAVEAGAATLRVGAARRDGWLQVTIADDGPGLPERVRERLFQPFAGSTKPGGTGLGLAIAREIVHAHGGEISLVATGGDGTVFRLDLPTPTGSSRSR